MSDLFRTRNPSQSEIEFFRKNSTVAGMATSDDAIILNPFSNLSETEKKSVILNERVRLFLRKKNIDPQFEIHPSQLKTFKDFQESGIPGEKEAKDVRATIIGRILSGDPSGEPYTPEQIKAAEIVKFKMGLR